MSILQAIIINTFDIFIYILLTTKLLQLKVYLKKHISYSILYGIFGGIINVNFHAQWYSAIISAVIVLSMIYLVYKKTFFETIYIYLISTILLMAQQLLILIPLRFIFIGIEINFQVALIAQLFNLIITIFIIKFVPIYYIYHFVIIKNKVFEYIIINAFITIFLLLIYWNINLEGVIENLVSITAISLIIIFINFTILRNSLKNEHTLNKLKVNEQYMPIIDELISDIKMRQHDFKNHLQALHMMIYASKDKEELMKRFEAYTGQIANKDELNEFLKYSNKVIAGFLYGKKSQAEAQHIKFSIQIKEPVFDSKLNDYEWIELFGILIDNAMETSVEDNEIIVMIDKEKDMNLLVVKNKHPYLEKEIIKNMFNKGVSSKSKSKASRGYGLYNVKQIVIKYHGSIEAYNEAGAENFVVLKALIP